MIKLTGKLNISSQELEDFVRSNFKKAVQKTVAKTSQRVQAQAQSRLRKGLHHWRDGFSVDEISDDTYILTLNGKLASMMEDGIGVGEISKMIMKGNRAKHNKAEGKDYVDVPITKSKVSSVQVFKDADALMKQFERKPVKFSDIQRGGVKQEDRHLRRVKELIESKKTEDSESQFLVIKRVTKNSIWPQQPFAGARAFETGSKKIAEDFENILRSVF